MLASMGILVSTASKIMVSLTTRDSGGHSLLLICQTSSQPCRGPEVPHLLRPKQPSCGPSKGGGWAAATYDFPQLRKPVRATLPSGMCQWATPCCWSVGAKGQREGGEGCMEGGTHPEQGSQCPWYGLGGSKKQRYM